MAFGAVRAAKELGLRVPEDLSVVGFDNIPFSSYFAPPLTTVEIPKYPMGAAAMEMLVNLISKKNAERLRWFHTQFLIRDSTGSDRRAKLKGPLLTFFFCFIRMYGKALP